MDLENRVVVLIDMDCFYCQVEAKLNPELKGKPIAVVQYNPWKGGGIIAVNYEARARGVTRHMRGEEAKEKCPEIELPSVPCNRGKADISKYRDAGKEVARVLQKFTTLLERASIDEAYLDITEPVKNRLHQLNLNDITKDMIPNSYALGYNNIEDLIEDINQGGNDSIDFDYEHTKKLLVSAVVVSEIRAAVYEETGYRCSAGIAHNKILAKLVCGMNKPNKQTILPKHSVNILYSTLSVKKVKHLGGKFGETVCNTLKITNMIELQQFSERELQTKFDEKNGSWLYQIARGINLELVQARFNPKSIGCCKQFKGKAALLDLESLKKWLIDLGDEIDDRLENDSLENNRTPKQMVVSFQSQLADGRETSSSRSYNFTVDDELCGELFSSKAFELVMEGCEGSKPKDGEENRILKTPIKFLGISVGKFEDNSESKKTKKILDYFSTGTSKDESYKNKDSNIKENDKSSINKLKSKKPDKDYVFKKFFQSTSKPSVSDDKSYVEKPVEHILNNKVETPLDKQESFFEKFLNKDLSDINKVKLQEVTNVPGRPSTPICKVVQCGGEESNDTDCSGSTINLEINKSIALFEDDPQDVERVSSIRHLLNNSERVDDDRIDVPLEVIQNQTRNESRINFEGDHNEAVLQQQLETFECHECKKFIPTDMFDTHSDYHLALKLREEDRKQMRQDVKDNNNKKANVSNDNKKKKNDNTSKNDSVQSISNFFVKVDVSAATEACSECGTRVSVEKFAEHLDFHEAQKLSKELNRKPTPVANKSFSIKRKKKSISPQTKTKMPFKSIDSFFKS